MRMTSRTGSAQRIWGISKKVRRVEIRHRTRRFDFWGSLRRDEFASYERRTDAGGGTDVKDSIESLCLSPYVETFNSKVIKGFVPELRRRYVFFVFRDSYVLYYVRILSYLPTLPLGAGYDTRSIFLSRV